MYEIGKQIKKYRTAKGITQEQLGNLVGVTTQAVSKWERGGVPDAELLPNLSRALDVSIDTLFGLKEPDASLGLIRKLSGMSQKDAFRHAFELCWAMIMGVHPLAAESSDEYIQMMTTEVQRENFATRFSTIYLDGGLMNARTQHDFKHFFMMLEPENGLRTCLSDIEGIRRVFAVLADPDKLRILLFLYTRLNTPIASSLISKNTGFSIPEVDRHMEELCQAGYAKRTAIAIDGGEMYSYMFNQEAAVVALLCLADEIRCTDEHNIVWDVNRQRPLMYSTDN